MITVAPSILACDFARLADEVARVEAAGADWLHLDVMDGHFVPNLSFGADIVAAVGRHSRLPLDVHLMVEEPGPPLLRMFVDAGADWLTVHLEACQDPAGTLAWIQDAGVRPGLAVKPATRAEAVEPLLSALDLVLIMSVEPGFGGQPFMPEALLKLSMLRRMLDASGSDARLSVDGGIDPSTGAEARAHGADVLVSGSAIFHAPDPQQVIGALRGLP
jgi:ribulose-phosphate 3-epimerase